MSDFLSKFNKDNYQDLLEEHNDKEKQARPLEKEESQRDQEYAEESTGSTKESVLEKTYNDLPEPPPTRSSYRENAEEEIEIDLDYRRKKRRKLWLIIIGSILAFLMIFFLYYLFIYVKVEDFVDRPVAEARAWAEDNNIEIELEQEYSMEYEANQIISQSVPAGEKIRKGKTLQLVSSLGPDPEEIIPLADFSKMNQEEAKQWIEDHKAENIQIVTEYSDDIEEGKFIKFTIKDSNIDESEYRRKDGAALYYSKGKEVFEKNITVPDFTGTSKEEVEKWAEANEIKMTYKESDSDTIEAGYIISQSIAAEEKVAKRDKMEVVVSTGKAIIVPNFWGLTPEEATANFPNLDVTVKQVFHAEVPYGTLISQSIKADTKLTEKDDKHVIVTYSLGKPYLQDFRGYLEGDLPRLFFEEYKSKGADIKYTVKYVDSPEVKGTVVHMSKFNEFVPMTYTVEISISNNTKAPPSPPSFPDEEHELGGPAESEDVEGALVEEETNEKK